ncbi:MAG: ester cyclase [Acidimicrobiia bacterium]|nr:ester cyclase [Acidimicrobiia bacterium]
MPPKSNASAGESVIREWFRRVWNELDRSAIEELLAPDCVAHWLGAEPTRGPKAFEEFHAFLCSHFHGIHVEIVREIQASDLVAFQAEVHLMPVGQQGPVRFNGGAFARVQGRQILETWDCWDFLGLLERMGALPQGTFNLALSGELSATSTASQSRRERPQGSARSAAAE